MKSVAVIFDDQSNIIKRLEVITLREAVEAANNIGEKAQKISLVTQAYAPIFHHNTIITKEFLRCGNSEDWYSKEYNLLEDVDLYISSDSEEKAKSTPETKEEENKYSDTKEEEKEDRAHRRGMY